MLHRRALLIAAVAGLPTWALLGCGFELRKAPNFAFDTLFLAVAPASPMGQELRRNLASNPNLIVLIDAKQLDKAQVILDFQQEAREKQIVAYNSAGQVREYQLRLRFKFRLRTPNGNELISSTEIVQQRDISFNESAALSKEAEEQLLYRDMQSDIVQQTLRRLAAVQSLK
jgi:LPS-assembly lipoprotein